MSRTIYKYEIVGDETTIDMPRGAEVLPKLHQNGPNAINFWAIVDPQLPTQPRTFEVFGTGHPIGSLLAKGDYIGTVITHAGFVWHVFEVTP